MLIAVVGPTTAGKSDLAVDLALALDGEVINADSMQLYRGMDIGTAKLTVERAPGRPASPARRLGRDQDRQRRRVPGPGGRGHRRHQARGKVPVLVGGSGLYIRAALGDLEFPGTDDAIRERLEAELAASRPRCRFTSGCRPPTRSRRPRSCHRNGRRIVRALEVIELSGRPFSATLPGYDAGRPAVQIGVQRGPARTRPADRGPRRPHVGGRVRGGGARAGRRGLRDGKTASRALGYQQVLRALDGE